MEDGLCACAPRELRQRIYWQCWSGLAERAVEYCMAEKRDMRAPSLRSLGCTSPELQYSIRIPATITTVPRRTRARGTCRTCSVVISLACAELVRQRRANAAKLKMK